MFNSIDLAIITALPIERDAVLKHLGNCKYDSNAGYWHCRVDSFDITGNSELSLIAYNKLSC